MDTSIHLLCFTNFYDTKWHAWFQNDVRHTHQCIQHQWKYYIFSNFKSYHMCNFNIFSVFNLLLYSRLCNNTLQCSVSSLCFQIMHKTIVPKVFIDITFQYHSNQSDYNSCLSDLWVEPHHYVPADIVAKYFHEWPN